MTEFSPTFYSPTLTGVVNITGSLAVIGDITVDANITANNFTVNNNFTAVNINGTNVTATAALSGATLAISGASTFAGNLAAGSFSTAGGLTATGAISGGSLAISGATTFAGALTAGSLNTAGAITGDTLTIAGATTFAGAITAPNVVANNSISGATLTVTGNANAVNFIASNNVTTLSLISSGANIDALIINEIISQPTFLNVNGATFVGPVIANGGITAVGGTVNINANTDINGTLSATVFSSPTVTASTLVVNGQLTVNGEIVNPNQLRTGRLISAQTAIQGRPPLFIISNSTVTASLFDRCFYVVSAGGYSVQIPTVFAITTQYPFLIGGGGFDFWYANTSPGTLTVLRSASVSINYGANVYTSYIIPAGRTAFLRFQIEADALSANVFIVGVCDTP